MIDFLSTEVTCISLYGGLWLLALYNQYNLYIINVYYIYMLPTLVNVLCPGVLACVVMKVEEDFALCVSVSLF